VVEIVGSGLRSSLKSPFSFFTSTCSHGYSLNEWSKPAIIQVAVASTRLFWG
jgi:hypothetical protein